MQYLVTMDYIDPGPLLSREQLEPVALNQTKPTTEALIDLSSQEKIRGGVVVGEVGHSFLS